MLSIRPATARDLETIVDFNCRLAQETEHKQLDRPTVTRGVERALARPEFCRYWIAERGGRAVGQMMVTYEWTDWRDGVFWWLQSVYVVADARGQGVFRALYDQVTSEARQDPDVRGIRLYVERENQPALATYTRMGLSPSGHLVYEIDWTRT